MPQKGYKFIGRLIEEIKLRLIHAKRLKHSKQITDYESKNKKQNKKHQGSMDGKKCYKND